MDTLETIIKRILVFITIILLAGNSSFGQTQKPGIPYLETEPVIDGLPDEQLNVQSWKDFAQIEKSDEQNPDCPVRYKMGYTYSHLYLLIESASDSIIYRDRAYQNGDGFHLVIAKPTADNAADEFYVLRFSPVNPRKYVSDYKRVWYYNIDLSGKQLSSATRFACQASKGKCYFELLLSWSDAYPYHPLFSDSMGINLCFVKAIGDTEKNYHFLKYDYYIQSEQKKRDYLVVDFKLPEELPGPFSLARLERNNIVQGDSVRIKTVSFAPNNGKRNWYFALRSADNYTYSDLAGEIQVQQGKNPGEFIFHSEKLLPGGYKLFWKCSDSSEGEIPLTILPKITFDAEKAVLDKLKNVISEGDYSTLLFMLQNLANDFRKVKEYETAGNIRERYNSYHQLVELAQIDNQAVSGQKGTFRRAFRSKIDSTLQPYSIKIPENFDRSKKYPLLVLLHGSGSTDQGMLNQNLTANRCIEIAPYGRGTSNCFTTDGAEIDVKEAIDDVIRNYPVDTSKIILSGFSMGGYGAYRIFYEYPRFFKAVVVFSGNPNLASQWIGEGFPNFLQAKYQKPFKGVPMFIYHSKNDLNCPYPLTLQLVNQLKKVGAKVEFVPVPESGHGLLDQESFPKFDSWLKTQLEE